MRRPGISAAMLTAAALALCSQPKRVEDMTNDELKTPPEPIPAPESRQVRRARERKAAS